MTDYQKRVIELEKCVDLLTREKDELYKDIERMCLNNESSFWSSSSVLSERIQQTENELSELKKENNKLRAQKDSLRDDNTQLRLTKKDADRLVKEEMDKNIALERELAFYKKHCAKALEDKNLYSYEVEELKKTNMELERGVLDAKAKLETEAFQREELEGRKKQAEERIVLLEERLIDCARIPELETQLNFSRTENDNLKKKISLLENTTKDYGEKIGTSMEDFEKMKEVNDVLESELESVKKESEMSIEIERNKVKELEQKLIDTLSEFKTSQGELQDADAAVAAARAQAELTQADRSHEVELLKDDYESRIESLERKILDIEELLSKKSGELQTAIEAKVTALEKASDWESKFTSLQQRFKDGSVGKLDLKTSKLRSLEASGSIPSSLDKKGISGGNSGLSVEGSTGSFSSKLNFKQGMTEASNAFNIFKSRQNKETAEEISKDLSGQIKMLNTVIGRVNTLVPRFNNLYEKLEKADPMNTNSRRESQNRLEAVKRETEKLKDELKEHNIILSNNTELMELSDGEKENLERELGLSALRFVEYGIGRLRDIISASQ